MNQIWRHQYPSSGLPLLYTTAAGFCHQSLRHISTRLESWQFATTWSILDGTRTLGLSRDHTGHRSTRLWYECPVAWTQTPSRTQQVTRAIDTRTWFAAITACGGGRWRRQGAAQWKTETRGRHAGNQLSHHHGRLKCQRAWSEGHRCVLSYTYSIVCISMPSRAMIRLKRPLSLSLSLYERYDWLTDCFQTASRSLSDRYWYSVYDRGMLLMQLVYRCPSHRGDSDDGRCLRPCGAGLEWPTVRAVRRFVDSDTSSATGARLTKWQGIMTSSARRRQLAEYDIKKSIEYTPCYCPACYRMSRSTRCTVKITVAFAVTCCLHASTYRYLCKMKSEQWRLKNHKYWNNCVAKLAHFTLELLPFLYVLLKLWNCRHVGLWGKNSLNGFKNDSH